jgi:hypothetical protein
MTRVIVDNELLGRLLNLAQPLEFCNETGRVLGTFTPNHQREAALRAEPFVSEEELHQRAQGDGFDTNDVITALERL